MWQKNFGTNAQIGKLFICIVKVYHKKRKLQLAPQHFFTTEMLD